MPFGITWCIASCDPTITRDSSQWTCRWYRSLLIHWRPYPNIMAFMQVLTLSHISPWSLSHNFAEWFSIIFTTLLRCWTIPSISPIRITISEFLSTYRSSTQHITTHIHLSIYLYIYIYRYLHISPLSPQYLPPKSPKPVSTHLSQAFLPGLPRSSARTSSRSAHGWWIGPAAPSRRVPRWRRGRCKRLSRSVFWRTIWLDLTRTWRFCHSIQITW